MVDLSELQSIWDDATSDKPQQTKADTVKKEYKDLHVPDGLHSGIIKDAGYNDGSSSKSGSQYVWWDVYYPALNGKRRIFQHITANEKALRILSQQFTALGLPLQSPTQIPTKVGETVGLQVQISKTTKGAYDNFYFRKVLDTPIVDDSAEDDSEMPF